jgi:hypothetical protein
MILLTALGIYLPMPMPDAPRRAHRRGCAELFLRHTAFLRSHSAGGELEIDYARERENV